MIEISKYLQDGANYQAQAVLAIMRAREAEVRSHSLEKYKTLKSLDEDASRLFHYAAENTHIEVGRYENCREQGYVFTLYLGIDQDKHYAVYEHRNSDQLIVLCPPKKNYTTNTPTIEQMWGDRNRGKYDYNKAFSCEQIVECADYICEDMKKQIDRYFELSLKLKEVRKETDGNMPEYYKQAVALRTKYNDYTKEID